MKTEVPDGQKTGGPERDNRERWLYFLIGLTLARNGRWLDLDKRQQWLGFLIGLILALMIVASACGLYLAAPGDNETPLGTKRVLVWVFLGGFVGGAGRSLYMLTFQWGGHGKWRVSSYGDKWFVYLLKPFVGLVGGFSFVLAVNLGLASLFTGEKAEFGFFRTLLTSTIGALFFEDVFAVLKNAVHKHQD